MDVSKASAALARLSTARRDDYTGWLHVGMALRELGAIGYELWLAWSASSPKYDVGECQDKWQTFRVGTPGGTDITLASLYRYARDDAGEPVSTLDDAERLQLQDLQARDVQTQRILAMDAPMSAKAVWLGMLPRLDAKRVLVADKHEHSGSLAVNYGTFADIMNTSKATVARAIDVGEKAGLWRKDAEHKADAAGYDILAMRLDLQPAYFDAALAEPIEQKPRGGKRAGAGRKPKCADCPPRTRVLRRTEITYVCDGCGQVLDAEPVRVEYLPDDAPAAGEFKHETVDALPMDATRQAEHAGEFKHETEYIAGTTTVSCLKKTLDVPAILAETYDMPSALRLADTYAPADATECRHYKTSLVWTQRGEHAKAAALAAHVHDERARAILLHLANRAPTLVPV
jgi:ribosomal protein S27E